MLGKANGGGIIATLNVTCPNSSTITATNGNLTFSVTGRTAAFKIPRTGNWTVTASCNGLYEQQTVSVSAGQTINRSMLYTLHIFSNGTYAHGFSSGWTGWYQKSGGGGTENYDPVTNGYVEATARIVQHETHAYSSGWVNLTGYRTVRFVIDGYTGTRGQIGNGKVEVQIRQTGTASVVQTTGDIWGGDQSYSETRDLDVSSINAGVYFEIVAKEWEGEAQIKLHDIYLIA